MTLPDSLTNARPTRTIDGSRSSPPVPADRQLFTVANRVADFMEALGVDRSDPHLEGTEWRVARAYRELLQGLDVDAEPELRTFPNNEGYDKLVTLHDVPIYSLCAHHFLPFFGTAHLAYLPSDRVVGLSKLARVVEYCARRPQTQERLTQQIANFLHDRLEPRGVMVVVEARHLCLEMRGVQKAGVTTRTSASLGTAIANEWLALRSGLSDPGRRI